MIKDKTFMKIAFLVSEESKAQRRKVGAIIVKDNNIIAIGYNGTPSGFDNCCEDRVIKEIDLKEGSLVQGFSGFAISGDVKNSELRTRPEVLHAESNAISKCARSSSSSEGASIYTTCAPCLECAKLILQSGIAKVFYFDEYSSTEGIELLKQSKRVEVERINTLEYELTENEFNNIDPNNFNNGNGQYIGITQAMKNPEQLHPLCERLQTSNIPTISFKMNTNKETSKSHSLDNYLKSIEFNQEKQDHLNNALRKHFGSGFHIHSEKPDSNEFKIGTDFLKEGFKIYRVPMTLLDTSENVKIQLLNLVNIYNSIMLNKPNKIDYTALEFLKKSIFRIKAENKIEFSFPLLLVKNVKFK